MASVAELHAAADLSRARFVCVVCRGAGLLPPLVRVQPHSAVALLLTHGEPPAAADPANDAVRLLDELDAELYAIKHGWVAGPAERPGALAISAELIAAVLDAAQHDAIGWELDPDFGYEIATRIPGMDGPEALALSPRLLYTQLGRVYEHAALVEAIKRERRFILESIEGLDPAIAGALG